MLAVARDEQGAVIAMGSAQLVISTAEGAPSAWIEDIVVHSDYRRRGIGKQLLEHLLVWAKTRGATRAQLVADKGNAGAELFYGGLGWQPTQLAVRRRVIE
jgi:GNAT superfamily N-acetyltransferase